MGEGRFSRIGWDDAWDILRTRLPEVMRRHGGEAVLPYSYAGSMGMVNRFAGHTFFYRLGALRLVVTDRVTGATGDRSTGATKTRPCSSWTGAIIFRFSCFFTLFFHVLGECFHDSRVTMAWVEAVIAGPGGRGVVEDEAADRAILQPSS
ncbi:molybdopterin-dependent oxidoreductase [Desulfoprunum benzoelyticum]|uniref:Uncharacterized protein n=2 Tax=Desulfoprunum benzoelyticum TaxID=1506996 RepID=A0A840V345_9BACT|nr:hypothetical protein [Desulfoprunum benzoelyticum]MBM9530821.1 molybdopterin-dependent oxidoreductase [Desulfoprunum benzoelyticum]